MSEHAPNHGDAQAPAELATLGNVAGGGVRVATVCWFVSLRRR